ncbi:unnamed protein product, partial [Urochloa humidicola]
AKFLAGAAPSQAPLRPLLRRLVVLAGRPFRPLLHRLLVLAGCPLRLLLRHLLTVHAVVHLPAATSSSVHPRRRRLRSLAVRTAKNHTATFPGCHGEKQGAAATSPAAPASGRNV